MVENRYNTMMKMKLSVFTYRIKMFFFFAKTYSFGYSYVNK